MNVYSEKCKESKAVATEQKVITFLSITHITEAVEGQEESRGKNHDSPTRSLSALNKMYRKCGARNSKILLSHFFFVLGEVDWNTLEADIRFSMYCPKTWFSDRNFKFSSFTLSTRWDKSASTHVNIANGFLLFVCFYMKVTNTS